MDSRRLLGRSFSADGRPNNHRTSDRSAGEGNDSYRDTVRQESRNTLYSVLAQLTELTQPMFETTLKSRAVSETSNVKFSCVVSGYPPPEVTWYKDDVQLDKYCSLPKYEIIHEDKNHSLRIYNCSLEDAAIYQVSARNSQGIVSCSGVLEVGTMNEYMIHQNYFAKLKQKAKSHQRGQEDGRRPDKENVPEAMEAVKATSPERALRKRRSPTDASVPHPAFPPQPEELRDHTEKEEATNELNTDAPQPSATSVSAVSHDEAFSNRVKCNNGQAIVDHNMIDVANFTSNRMPDKELFVNKKKIKISAEGGERGREDRQVERELGRKKEMTQRGKDRNLPKANMSLLPSEEQMEIDSKVSQAKTISELRGTIKDVNPELRKNVISEKRAEMGPPTRSKSTTKPPAPQKQPMVKISTVTKTETTTRPIWLKKSTKVKKENSVSAVPSHAPSHLPDVTPQSRTVKQLLTNKDQTGIEGNRPSRPGDPLPSEPARGDTGHARRSVVSREYIEAPGGLNSGLTKEQALFENVTIRPQTEGRITLVKDTRGKNVSIPYTTSTATTDHMPVHMETAPCDKSPPSHRETHTELKPQRSNEVTDDNTGKPSSYKQIKNNKLRQNVVQLPIGSDKGDTHPGTEHRQKGQEPSVLVDNISPGQSSHTQQGQVISALNTSEAAAKKKDKEPVTRNTKERCSRNKPVTPAADTLTKSQQREVDVCVTQIGNNEAISVNTRKETEDRLKNKERLVPNVFDGCQVTVAESQLHHNSNMLNPGTLQLQTQELSQHSSRMEQPTDIQECKKTSASPIPAVDERAAPGNSSLEYEEKLLVENDFEKTGNEACFPPVSLAPAGKPPKSEALPSSKLLSACLEKLIPMIYVTDMDSAQENDSVDATTPTSPDFKNRNKSAESGVANGSVTTNEETNSMFNQTGEMGKQRVAVITDSAPLTANTLPVVVSAPLNLNLPDANGACQGDEERTKDSFTALSSQSADTAGSGPVTDNNTPSFAEGSTTTKLTGTAETTNITSLVMQNFTRLSLGSECPDRSQESNPLLTDNHVPPPAPDSACLTQYLKEAALELEDEIDTAVVVQNATPKQGVHLGTEETTQVKGGESNEQVARDTEVKKGAPQWGSISPQQALSTPQALTPTERPSSELIHQDQEPVKGPEQRPENRNANDWAESAATDEQNQLKAPQVIGKIRPEICDASRNMKLWCQFFNVLSDSTLTWYKDDVEIAEMKRSAGDESQVSLAVVQVSERDCGLYRCTITNEYGADFTDYLLASESISSLVLRKASAEVGEEVEMTALLFGKGLPDTGYWSNTFYGRVLTEETQLGMGCEHKTRRSKVIYGLDPVFDSGSSCLIKVRSPIAYRGREDISLAERNIQMTKQACKIQNLTREYCKIFAAQTRLIENFGSELEVLPLYFIYRPASSIPYATAEVELNGVYLRYCGLDKVGSLIVRERSEVAQKCCCFQHWIYQATSGNLLVTRLEGIDTIITNIGVSVKCEGYQGFPCRPNALVFESFQSQHQCNYFCGLLGLRPLKGTQRLGPHSDPRGLTAPRFPRRTDSAQSPQTPRKTFHKQR